jgi:hypothetical protein
MPCKVQGLTIQIKLHLFYLQNSHGQAIVLRFNSLHKLSLDLIPQTSIEARLEMLSVDVDDSDFFKYQNFCFPNGWTYLANDIHASVMCHKPYH